MTCRHRPLGALLAAALLMGGAAPAEAGFRNFVDSFVGLLDTTNTSITAAGDKLKAGLKQGDVKQAMSDFDTGLKEAEAQMAPKRAAVWESLADLPMWIPQAIKHTWGQFMGALKKIVGVLLPGNGGGEDPQPAPPPADPPADPPPADPPADPPPADPPADPPPADPPADPPPADPPADPPGDGESDPPPADEGGDDAKPDDPDDGGEEAPPAAEEGDEEAGEQPGTQPDAEAGSAEDSPVDPAPDAGDEAPATRASADQWEAAKQGFQAADRKLQFETYGRLGALLAAEASKQARGRDKGALDERASKLLLGKLDEVRDLHGWMAQHLAEVLSGGQGLEALGTQLKALGPKASLQAFGPVVREARRRSQRRSVEVQGPAAPTSTAVRLGKIMGWMSGPR